MKKLSEEKLKRAREQFLLFNEASRLKIAALTEQDAAAMETTLEKLRDAETIKEIAREAHKIGEDTQVLIFSYAAEDANEFGRLYAEWNAATGQ